MLRFLLALGCLCIAVSAVPAAAAEAPRAVPARPNVIFILADDLGYGDLGCYGQKRIQTPNIDRLAREGMRFRQFYAGSTVCAPSRCALMTGRHMGHALIRGNGRDPLRPADTTVARVLKEAGYTTGLVGKWGLGEEGSTGIPTRQGFDSFYGYLNQHHAHNYYPAYLFRNAQRVPLKNEVPGTGDFGSGVATKKIQYSHDLLTEEALAFVDSNRDRPFFLYLAWTIPHANNEAGKNGMEVPVLGPYKERDWPLFARAHAAMITRMDADVGRLLDRLKKHGLDEKTLIFFSSDNGPHREGGNDPDFHDSNGPLQGIKRDLYEGGIRVPMMARWPGHVPAGTTSDLVGAFWDVLPTLAGLCGGKTPDGLDGISFVPTLLGQSERQKPHDSLYWAFYERGGSRALRMGKWKAVEQPIGKPIQLFNLEEDLGEQTDLSAKHPDLVATLRKKMDGAYTPSERWKFPTAGARKPRPQ
jgi:arylsulfatase A-like enzyme